MYKYALHRGIFFSQISSNIIIVKLYLSLFLRNAESRQADVSASYMCTFLQCLLLLQNLLAFVCCYKVIGTVSQGIHIYARFQQQSFRHHYKAIAILFNIYIFNTHAYKPRK